LKRRPNIDIAVLYMRLKDVPWTERDTSSILLQRENYKELGESSKITFCFLYKDYF
jgi:hypothetical protein